MDIKTIVLSYLISNAVCALVVFALWQQNRRRFNGLEFWLAAYLTQFAGLALIMMRNYLPDFISSVVGSGVFIGGMLLLYVGFERFLGSRSNQMHNYILLGLFVAAHAFFLLIHPSMTARSVNLFLALIALCAQLVWLIFRRADATLRPIARETGFIFVAHGMVSLLRVLNVVMPLDENLFQAGLFESIMLMAYQMLFIALTFNLFMLVNRRLTLNLQEDVAERKRVEEALRFSEEKFFKAFHSSPDLVTITRLDDGRFVEVNESFLRVAGYSREEALNPATTTLQIWANPQDREFFLQTLQREQAVRESEYNYRTRSGDIRTGLLSAEIIQLGNEPHIVSIIHDITERKQAEDALRISEERYRHFIVQSFEAISRTEFDHPIDITLPVEEQIDRIYENAFMAECNQSMADIYHVPSPDAFVGMRLIDAHGGKDNPINRETFRRLIENGYKSVNDETKEYTVDGNPIWFLSNTIGTVENGYLVRLWGTAINITERKQAEEALRASQSLYNTLVNQLPQNLYRLDRNGQVLFINKTLHQNMGAPLEDIIGKNAYDLYPADRARKYRAEDAQVIASGKSLTLIDVIKSPVTGEVSYTEGIKMPVFDEDGNVCGIQGIFYDVTERKQAEDKLRASEENFRQLIMSAPDVVVVVNREGKITYANAEAVNLLGYAPDEFIGMDVEKLIPQKSRATHISHRAAYMNAPRTRYMGSPLELTAVHKDGSEIPVDIKLSQFKMGEDVQVIAFMRDITQQKLTEYRMRQQTEMIELAYAAVIMCDLNGQIRYWNAGARDLYGWESREAIGKNVHELLRSQFPASLEELQQGLLATGYWDGELRHTCKDGREVIVSSRQSLQRNKKGQPDVVLEVNLDITERIQKDAALRVAQTQIVEQQRSVAALEERERLARELHDGIGQTLGYINMQAEAAQELSGKGSAESASRMLARLAEVARETHSDLRGYIQNLKQETPAAREDFFSALERYCQHLRQAYLFDVKLAFPNILPDPLASVQAEAHLTYIIREALSNARRYSGQNEAAITIEVDNETMLAAIEDHGVGMPAPYAGNERRTREHFGIRIMRERANEVGGTLTIESEAGKSTRVIVRMPRNLSAGEFTQMRVMIVDDHPLFVEGLRNMLATRGAQVIGAARDGVEAQAMARALKPNLILMDINMPRMGGLSATRQIKAEMPDMKIVMLTTSASEADLFEALRAGAGGYLLKGMSADQFFATLDSVARGEAEFSEEMAKRILAEFPLGDGAGAQKTDAAPDSGLGMLTERQIEILRLVAGGLMYRTIAERLFLTESTVKYHMGEILSHLQLKGRRQAEKYAKQRGIK